jgi:hypothetical protein
MTTEEHRIVIIRSSLDPSGRGIWSPTPVPSALHICADSRAVALKIYRLSFSVPPQDKPVWPLYLRASFPAQIYFIFERDIIYFRSRVANGLRHLHAFQASCLTADMQRVQAVGVGIDAMSGGYVGLCPVTFEGLETLYVCQERARLDTKRAITFCPLRKGQEWAFVKEYQWSRDRARVFRHLSLAATIDKIKDEILSLNPYEDLVRPDIRLVTVANA